MRERLIELLCGFFGCDTGYYGFGSNELADYLLANGVIVPPVKVGDTVWAWWTDEDGSFIDKGVVFAIGVDERKTMWISARYESGLSFYHPSSDIGKALFRTREEAAEAALKAREAK